MRSAKKGIPFGEDYPGLTYDGCHIVRGDTQNYTIMNVSTYQVVGMSPAFNVDTTKILFNSLVSGTAGEEGAEYKLTLKDSDMTVGVSSDAVSDGQTVTVPYTLSGTGTFKLNESAWGAGYKVYLVAEDVNGEKETDYASAPVAVNIKELTDAEKVAAAETAVSQVITNLQATNDTKETDVKNAIDTALDGTGVTATIENYTVKEATTSEAGTITGTVTLNCNAASDTVPISKTIAKLSNTDNTDAQKIAAVKAAVEKVIADLQVSNVTKEADLLILINKALEGTGVTATIVNYAVKEATSTAAGTITGTVTLKSNAASDTITISKTIAKLTQTDTGTNAETESVSQKEQTKNEMSMNSKLKVSQVGSKINVSWGKVAGATGYDVYAQYCGSKFAANPTKAIKSGKTNRVTITKINGKALNLKKNYKIYVLAYKMVDNKKVTMGQTIIAYIVGRKNATSTNVKSIKLKKKSYSLKKGKTATIKASTVLVDKKKKPLNNAHAKQFRYATSNEKIAKVSSAGKIKAVGKGKCTLYIYARNGYAKTITVTVK